MRILALFIYCFFSINVLFSQIERKNYVLEGIDNAFIGYYISVDLINILEETKNYNLSRELALNENDRYVEIYVHIIVRENRILYYPFYSDLSFKVSKDKFEKFDFKYVNGDKIIIDHNGDIYKKITTDLINYEKIMNNFIGNIILSDFISAGEIIIENDFIMIPSLNNKKLKISTWFYYDAPDINLRLYDYEFGNKWTVFLKKNNQKLTINYDPPIWYRGERFHIIWEMDI